jgi:hypothetical protein
MIKRKSYYNVYIASRCDVGGILYEGVCYYFYSTPETYLNYNDAKEFCESAGHDSSLVAILSQDVNDFLSEAIFTNFDGNA